MIQTGRARVVVADDHPHVLHCVTRLLAQTFDVVASVGGGEAAIEATLRLDPDVVVLDVAMPGVDGFEAAARISASGSPARIVFLSNHADEHFELAAVSRGASAFVAKVRMTADLQTAMAHALNGRAFVSNPAVLPCWRRPAGRRHDLLIYQTDAFLVDAVMIFFERALEVGDSIVAIGYESHLQELHARFAARGLDTASLLAAGRYSFLDSAAALAAACRQGMPDAELWRAAVDPMIERALRASTGSPRHVSFFGEVAPILRARGEFEAMARLEQIADEYTASRPLSLLCAYSSDGLGADGDLMAQICQKHSTVVVDPRWSATS